MNKEMKNKTKQYNISHITLANMKKERYNIQKEIQICALLWRANFAIATHILNTYTI